MTIQNPSCLVGPGTVASEKHTRRKQTTTQGVARRLAWFYGSFPVLAVVTVCWVISERPHAGPLDFCINPDDAMLMYEFLSLLKVDIN